MKLKLVAVYLLCLSALSACNDSEKSGEKSGEKVEKNNKTESSKQSEDVGNVENKDNSDANNNNIDADDEFEEVYEECITRLRAIKEGKKTGNTNSKKQQKNNQNKEKVESIEANDSSNQKQTDEKINVEEESKIKAKKEEEDRKKEEEKTRKSELKKQEEEIFEVTEKDIILGDPTSSVKIIEYSSFTCPSCAYYNKKYFPNIHNKYIKTGKISYVIREIVNNKQDLYATLLVRCMLKHNGMENYQKIRNLLFEKQNSWAFTKNFIDILTNIAQLSGLSDNLYLKCVNDKEMNDEIIDDLKKISEYKNDEFGTPFFVINKSPAANRFDLLDEEIERSAQKQKAKN
jgi:protein-disulfide isomerase